MTGKRSDQYQVDPSNPTTSDKRDNPADEKLMTREKHEFANSEKHKDEGLIPKRGVNPALADLQAKRAERAESEEQDDTAASGDA